MAFNTNAGRQSFTATAAQTDFVFNFKIYAETDIKVYLTPVGQTPDDTTDLLTYASEYTVVIDGDNGGTVTLLSAATLNDTVVIERVLPRTRTTSYVTNGDLLAATLNLDQDYQTYLLVDDFNTADRSLSLPSTDVTMSPELPSTLAGQYLRVKSDSTAFEYVDVDSILSLVGGIDGSTVDLQTANLTLKHRRGTTAEADSFTGAAGELYVDTTMNRLRLHDGSKAGGHTVGELVNVIAEGATVYPDISSCLAGAVDATPFIESALSKGGVYIPEGYYYIGTNLTIDENTTKMIGDSMYGTNLVLGNNVTGDIVTISGVSHIRIENITLWGNSANNTLNTNHGLKLFDTYYSSIKQVIVRDTTGYGYYVTNANNNTFETCQTMITGSYGWYIGNDDAKNNVLIACGAENFVDYGMYIRGINTQLIAPWVENYGATPNCVGIHIHNRENNIYSPEVRGNATTALTIGIEFTATFSDRSALFGGTCYDSTTNISIGANADYISLYGWEASDVSDSGNNTLMQKGNFFSPLDLTNPTITSTAANLYMDSTNGNSGARMYLSGTTDNVLRVYNVDNSNELVLQILKPAFSSSVCSGGDNTQNLGFSSLRWKEVFAVNGTINTSDAREKQQERDLSSVERTVALRIKKMIKGFKWNDAVEEKGDKARWHFGVIAQDVQKVFEEYNLDPSDYGLFTYDEWEDQIDNETGKIVIPAGSRYGIRYTELLAFVIGAI